MSPSPLNQTIYFDRQSTAQTLGKDRLAKLQTKKVAIVGCGGVGSSTADYLARSGIRYFRLIDQDIVDQSNLSRMHCVGPGDLYRPKAEAVSEHLASGRPWMSIEPVVDTIRRGNVVALLDGVDLIIDGLDNFESRYFLNRFSVDNDVPYLFASAIGNQMHTMLVKGKSGACLRCVFPSAESCVEQSCEALGVTGSVIGLSGAIAANQATMLLIDHSRQTEGELLTIDLDGPDLFRSRMAKRTNCEDCGPERLDQKDPIRLGDVLMLCGEKSAAITPVGVTRIDLYWASKLVPPSSLLRLSNKALVFRMDQLTISLFNDGRMIIQGVDSTERALSVCQEVQNLINTPPNTS